MGNWTQQKNNVKDLISFNPSPSIKLSTFGCLNRSMAGIHGCIKILLPYLPQGTSCSSQVLCIEEVKEVPRFLSFNICVHTTKYHSRHSFQHSCILDESSTYGILVKLFK